MAEGELGRLAGIATSAIETGNWQVLQVARTPAGVKSDCRTKVVTGRTDQDSLPFLKAAGRHSSLFKLEAHASLQRRTKHSQSGAGVGVTDVWPLVVKGRLNLLSEPDRVLSRHPNSVRTEPVEVPVSWVKGLRQAQPEPKSASVSRMLRQTQHERAVHVTPGLRISVKNKK